MDENGLLIQLSLFFEVYSCMKNAMGEKVSDMCSLKLPNNYLINSTITITID